MTRPAFWLTAPSRFAALRRPQARMVIALSSILVLLCLLALRVPEPPMLSAVTGPDRGQTDLALYEKIVAAVRGGENYYTAAADALRAGGYPLRPFFTMRMPGLAVTLAALPEWLPRYLLFALGLTAGIAWMVRLRTALNRLLPRLGAALLLLGSLLAFLQPGLVAFHEIWAGLFVALSLALRRPGRWIEAAALALIAMLIRETALLYALVMAFFAWREGEGREALGWAVAILLFAVMLAVHAHAVLGVTGPLDPASPGWTGFWGLGLFVKSLTLATALQLLPLWGAALLVGLTMFGWAAWDDPLGARMLAVLAAYGLAIGLFARLDTFYWGLMVAPVFLVGLVFVPDGLRDLVRQALDRRRITVTRVAR
jgi:hypothetical protein